MHQVFMKRVMNKIEGEEEEKNCCIKKLKKEKAV